MNDTLVTTDHLSKKFKADFVLQDVNLSFERGKIYALVGEEGSGKSTFLSLLADLIRQTDGMIWFTDNLKGYYTIESPAILENMTVSDNIKLRCILLDTPFSDIDSIVEYVNISLMMQKKVRDIEEIELQRLDIALALLSKPDFIIFDEPFAKLLLSENDQIGKLYREICQKYQISFLVTGDDLADFAPFADEFIIVHKGKIIKNITKAYLSKQVRQALSLSVSDPDAAMRILDVKLGIKETDVEDGYLIIKTGVPESKIVKVLNENAVRIFYTKQHFTRYDKYVESLIGGDEN
jgi:ABC-2 type transport system ATP-binding protein